MRAFEKNENRPHFFPKKIAKQQIFEYIELFYNRERRHSSLGYVSPEECERLQLKNAA